MPQFDNAALARLLRGQKVPRSTETASAVMLREATGFLASLRAEFPKLAFVADPVAGMRFAVGSGRHSAGADGDRVA